MHQVGHRCAPLGDGRRTYSCELGQLTAGAAARVRVFCVTRKAGYRPHKMTRISNYVVSIHPISLLLLRSGYKGSAPGQPQSPLSRAVGGASARLHYHSSVCAIIDGGSRYREIPRFRSPVSNIVVRARYREIPRYRAPAQDNAQSRKVLYCARPGTRPPVAVRGTQLRKPATTDTAATKIHTCPNEDRETACGLRSELAVARSAHVTRQPAVHTQPTQRVCTGRNGSAASPPLRRRVVACTGEEQVAQQRAVDAIVPRVRVGAGAPRAPACNHMSHVL